MRKLTIVSNAIGDPGAKHLADVLRVKTTLTNLSLNSTNIGDGGAAHLAGVLKVNATLTNLTLRKNGIRPEGFRHIADALRSNATLVRLDLLDNSVDGKTHMLMQEVWALAAHRHDRYDHGTRPCTAAAVVRLSTLAPIAAQHGNTTNSNQQIISFLKLPLPGPTPDRRSIGTRVERAQASAADQGTQQAMGDAALRPAQLPDQSEARLNPYHYQ
ncbi:hypothetical protein T492DRAFT_205290 [Pavlovales sp. CCMP2436]|nr:hypothetical protein T492DRAFT_205290 [Pavlovales sp. CCMP2436]